MAESNRRKTAVAAWVATAVCFISLATAASALADESESGLADALKEKDFATARELIEQRQDINAPQADGMTPLHWSVYHDHPKISARLVASGADVNAKNRYGVSALSLACANGNTDIVKLLLESGADPNSALRGGETPLMTAARTGNIGPVKALIEAGADVHAKERKRQTALMWAAADGNAEVVSALIEAGADAEAELRSGFTPIFFAIREGHRDVVFRLLEAGIDVNEPVKPRNVSKSGPRRRTTPLLLAVENGHFELAAELLGAGADPNDDRVGFSVLHAITWVRKPIRGDGDPPPIGSGRMSSLDFVRALIDAGADVNARYGKHKPNKSFLNRTDATAFFLAAETGDVPLMRLLLELGADPTLTNVDNCTPLLAAAGVGFISNGDETAGTEEDAIETIQLLLDLGANINAVDNLGKTAMHGAAAKSWVKLVHFLAANDADIEVWNTKLHLGWTPLQIAEGNRPGNFRPSAETIEAITEVMAAAK